MRYQCNTSAIPIQYITWHSVVIVLHVDDMFATPPRYIGVSVSGPSQWLPLYLHQLSTR